MSSQNRMKSGDMDIKEVKKRLISRKDELENELAEIASDTFPTDQVLDTGDQALSSSIEALKSSLQNAEFDEYTRIISALSMIEDGIYGICVECSCKISEKRLHYYPNATRCIACQEAFEDKI